VTAIVLAGHGSTVSPETGGLVRRAADILREWRVADEATAAFWKERPGFSEVADTLQSNKMIVVPVFAARGWYTDVVLPRELAKGRKDVEYVITPPVGEHPLVAELVETAALYGGTDFIGAESAVLVVGHGTSRHPNSRTQTRRIVERLREKGRSTPSFRENGIFQEVFEAFLDDEPKIPDGLAACRAQSIVVVPNFLTLSNHVERDVPNALGLSTATEWRDGKLEEVVGGRRIVYTAPGIMEYDVARMALELAEKAGLR